MSNYYDDDSKPGLSLKVVVVGLIGVVGIFGVSFTSIQNTLKDVARQENTPATAKLKSSSGESDRGAMTRLTKREINTKLAQIPVFLALDQDDAIVIKENTGRIFFSKKEADSFANENKAKVAATSLVTLTLSRTLTLTITTNLNPIYNPNTQDELYLSLVAKKSKPSVVGGLVAKSDPSATYIFVPSKAALSDAASEWKSVHSENDVPLFRVPKMAFEDPAGLILPLFQNKADALSSYERLQASKQANGEGGGTGGAKIAVPDIQTTSLLDIINLFNTGGFESRALEIFPDMENIEQAKSLMATKNVM